MKTQLPNIIFITGALQAEVPNKPKIVLTSLWNIPMKTIEHISLWGFIHSQPNIRPKYFA